MPSVPLEARITKDWQRIGFQGTDPATDFRGMGMLGLRCLQYPPTLTYNRRAHAKHTEALKCLPSHNM